MKIVIKNLNAKVGQEQTYESITGGLFCLHAETNDNEKKWIHISMETKIKITSTNIQRKDIYKETWMSVYRKTCYQIA